MTAHTPAWDAYVFNYSQVKKNQWRAVGLQFSCSCSKERKRRRTVDSKASCHGVALNG